MSKLLLDNLTVGQTVRGDLAVREATIKTASNGNYLYLVLTDGERDIEGKMWQYTGNTVPEVGSVVRVLATVGEWRGQQDLNIKRISKEAETPIKEFCKCSELDVEELYKTALCAIDEIRDEEIREVTSMIYTQHKELIIQTPAAKKNHHNYQGGLLEHSIEVMNYATALGHRYNKDYIIAGSLLHDIGKIDKYRWQGAAIEYTNEAHFEEHIARGYHLVMQCTSTINMDATKCSRLCHIILSHHGNKEWGSPVEPVTPEAYAVHLGDLASSRFDMFEQAKREAPEDSRWSERRWPLNIKWYLGE